jgi:hypothetical protein
MSVYSNKRFLILDKAKDMGIKGRKSVTEENGLLVE